MGRLQKLREKPRRDRQRIAFGGALIVTLMIALVWLSVVTVGSDSSVQTAHSSGSFHALWESISTTLPW